MRTVQAQVGSIEDDLGLLIGAAQSAWGALVAARPELLKDPPPPARPHKAKDAVEEVSSQPLDVPTALAWYDQVQRFLAANPRSATAAEIESVRAHHAGRYLPSRQPLPIDRMLAMRISPLQWHDVFGQAGKIKDKEERGGGKPSPLPINLILSLAEHQVKLRASIESKRKRLAAIRQAARQEPK